MDKLMVIEHGSAALLNKASGYSMYNGKQQNNPENRIPGNGFKNLNAEKSNKYGCQHLNKDAVQGMQLPELCPDFFPN